MLSGLPLLFWMTFVPPATRESLVTPAPCLSPVASDEARSAPLSLLYVLRGCGCLAAVAVFSSHMTNGKNPSPTIFLSPSAHGRKSDDLVLQFCLCATVRSPGNFPCLSVDVAQSLGLDPADSKPAVGKHPLTFNSEHSS